MVSAAISISSQASRLSRCGALSLLASSSSSSFRKTPELVEGSSLPRPGKSSYLVPKTDLKQECRTVNCVKHSLQFQLEFQLEMTLHVMYNRQSGGEGFIEEGFCGLLAVEPLDDLE